MFQQLFSNQGAITQQPYPRPIGDGTFQNIYMNTSEVNLQTRTKGYGMPDFLQGEDIPTTSSGPFNIPHPNNDHIPWIPKALLRLSTHNAL